MGQQVADGDAVGRPLAGELERRHVVRHRIVEDHGPELDLLQHRGRGQLLGDRADPEERVGIHRPATITALDAEAPLQDERAVIATATEAPGVPAAAML